MENRLSNIISSSHNCGRHPTAEAIGILNGSQISQEKFTKFTTSFFNHFELLSVTSIPSRQRDGPLRDGRISVLIPRDSNHSIQEPKYCSGCFCLWIAITLLNWNMGIFRVVVCGQLGIMGMGVISHPFRYFGGVFYFHLSFLRVDSLFICE